MNQFEVILSGDDLRSTGRSNDIVSKIKDQKAFDGLFECLFHKERIIVMRAADAVEKITITHPEFLAKHEKEIFQLCASAKNKELKWHLAQLIPRLSLNKKETANAWELLMAWSLDKNNSRIVRVNSLQALFELAIKENIFTTDLEDLLVKLSAENIPSINARVKKIRDRMKAPAKPD